MGDPNVLKCPLPCHDYQPVDIYRLVQANCQKYGDKIALIQSPGVSSYTYKQLQQYAERVAYHLDQLGVRRGDNVAFYAQNTVEWVIVMVATWRLGAVYAGINKLLTAYELEHALQIVSPTCVFTDNISIKNMLQALKTNKTVKVVLCRESHAGCVSFEHLTTPIPTGCQAPSIPDIDIDNDTGCILLSSGTTGLPKAVAISHKTCVFQMTFLLYAPFRLIRDYQNVFVPFSHIYGIMLSVGGMFDGVTSIIMEQFDLEQLLNNLQTYKTPILHLVPPLVVMLAKQALTKNYDFSHLEEIFCGAAPLGEEAIVEFRKRFGSHIHFRQGWGMTEVSGIGTIAPAKGASVTVSPYSVGLTIAGTELKVIDLECGKSVGPEQQGEICVRGPHVMLGYVKNPEATAQTIEPDGWLHTGDIGYYDKDGAVFVIDRLKELIKYKAYQVAPAELEDLLLSHPLVADSAVIGIPDEEAGEVPLAWVVKKEGASVTEQDVIDFVAEKAAPYKRLRGGVTFVDAIPKSPSGKILRKDIRIAVKTPKSHL